MVHFSRILVFYFDFPGSVRVAWRLGVCVLHPFAVVCVAACTPKKAGQFYPRLHPNHIALTVPRQLHIAVFCFKRPVFFEFFLLLIQKKYSYLFGNVVY